MGNKKPTGIILIGILEIVFGLIGITTLMQFSLGALVSPFLIVFLFAGIGLIMLKKWGRWLSIASLGLWFACAGGATISVLRQQINNPQAGNNLYFGASLFGLISFVLFLQMIYLFSPNIKTRFTR